MYTVRTVYYSLIESTNAINSYRSDPEMLGSAT